MRRCQLGQQLWQIVALGACNTRIYPTLVIKDTELEKLFRKGEYIPLSLEDAVNWTKEIVKIVEAGDVTILRIGLHPSDGILNGDTLVAGPFHVAFGEMVTSALWKDEFDKELSAGRKAEGVERKEQRAERTAHVGMRNEIECRLFENRKGNLTGDLRKQGLLIVEVPPGQLNAAVGHKAENKKMLLKKFNKVIFKENPELERRNFNMRIGSC